MSNSPYAENKAQIATDTLGNWNYINMTKKIICQTKTQEFEDEKKKADKNFKKYESNNKKKHVQIEQTRNRSRLSRTPESRNSMLSCERFIVLGFLGDGSYGEVYRGVDTCDNSQVALKMIDVELDKDGRPDLIDLKKEVKFMKSLKKIPQLVTYKGQYTVDHQWVIVMEYCDGGSLLDLMEVCEITFNEKEIVNITKEILVALDYLHTNDMVHRDVKAGNILIDTTGQVKLADFGISANLENGKKHTTIGTPYWMAPEVFIGMSKGYNGKVDIWSLGITCMELACGAPPRSDIHPMRAIFKIPHLPPPKLKKFSDKKWSDSFVQFLDMCLVKNPANRTCANELLKLKLFQEIEDNSELNKLIQKYLPQLETFRKLQMSERLQIEEELDIEEKNTSCKTMKTNMNDLPREFDPELDVEAYDMGTTVLGDELDVEAYDMGTTVLGDELDVEAYEYGTTVLENSESCGTGTTISKDVVEEDGRNHAKTVYDKPEKISEDFQCALFNAQ